jgi:hypothetical protein
MEILIAFVVGIVAALAGGAISGIRIGGADLGRDLAAYMGMLYGLIAGGGAVVIGLIAVVLIRGGL